MSRFPWLVALIAFANAGPVAAQSCAPFTDVAAASGFCTSIQWMYNRGITLGCAANAYCPSDAVTREQMAAFMFRLGNVTFQQGGNAFGAVAVLGTTDAQPLEVQANGSRVMRFEPRAQSPNVIGGAPANGVSPGVAGATIGGGGFSFAPNRVTEGSGTVAGGYGNQAGADTPGPVAANNATVGGGSSNKASAGNSTVGGGTSGTASGHSSTVSGGAINTASGRESTVAGGVGNTASGDWSMVAGGLLNRATGTSSFAAGQYAHAQNRGCFVWADASTEDAFVCAGDNAFIARAAGGFYLRTNATATTGVSVSGGSGAWSSASDRALKEHVVASDPRAVLDRLLDVPIATWNYKAQDPSIRHIGPMAQDVHAAFGVGESDRHISTVDADGIAFAAIQGLNAKLEAEVRAKDARIAALEARTEGLAADLAALRARLTPAPAARPRED